MPISSVDVEDNVATDSASGRLTLTNTPQELKVGVSRLSGRISLVIRCLDNDIYIGSTASVSASNGFVLKKDDVAVFAANGPIWGMSPSGSRDVALFEFSSEQPI